MPRLSRPRRRHRRPIAFAQLALEKFERQAVTSQCQRGIVTRPLVAQKRVLPVEFVPGEIQPRLSHRAVNPRPAFARHMRNHQFLGVNNAIASMPRAYDKPLYQQKCSALFEHIFESYPERDAGVYAEASAA